MKKLLITSFIFVNFLFVNVNSGQFFYDEKLDCLEIKEKLLEIELKKEKLESSMERSFSWDILTVVQMPSALINGNKIEQIEKRLKNLNRLEKIKCK